MIYRIHQGRQCVKGVFCIGPAGKKPLLNQCGGVRNIQRFLFTEIWGIKYIFGAVSQPYFLSFLACSFTVKTSQTPESYLAKCSYLQRLWWSCWDLIIEHWNCVHQYFIPVHLFQKTGGANRWDLEKPGLWKVSLVELDEWNHGNHSMILWSIVLKNFRLAMS